MDKNDNADPKDDAQEIPEADVGADPIAGLLSPAATFASGNIVDSDGFDINSSLDYKLMMSDGTELGMILNGALWFADESPSNGGAVIEFSPQTPPPVAGQVWGHGTTAFIRGASYNNGGPLLKQYLYVFSGGGVFHIAWTTNALEATKFLAFNVAGNRIALYAIFGTQTTLGIRLNKSKNLLEGDKSQLKLSLAGQFVRVQTLLPRIII